MAKFGRGKRRAQVARAPSTTTPTPLVRKRIIVILDDSLTRIRLRNKNRLAKLVRAKMPFPLRGRQLVKISTRRGVYAKRHPVKIVKPHLAPPIPPQPAKQPLVRATRRPTLLRRLSNLPLVKRAPSVTTPTALVRNRLVYRYQRNTARKYLFKTRERDVDVVRPKPAPLTVAQPAAQPKVKTRRISVARIRRHTQLLRSKFIAPPGARAVRVKNRAISKARARRHFTYIARSRNFPPPQRAGTQPHVREKRPAQLLRRLSNLPTITRAPSTPTATPLVRNRLTLVLRKRAGVVRSLRSRGEKQVKIVHAPSTPTATPLVRKRLVLSPLSNLRSRRVRDYAKRWPITTRNNRLGATPQIQPGKQSLVRQDRRPLLVRKLANLPVIKRGLSLTTPTPLNRKKVAQFSRKTRIVAFKRHVARVVRHGVITTPVTRNRINTRLTRVRVAAFKRHPVRINKNGIPPQPFVRGGRAVIKPSRRRHVVAFYKRHIPDFSRSKLWSPRPTKAVLPKINGTKRRIYFRKRHITVSRNHLPPPLPQRKRQPVVSRNQRRTAYARSRAHGCLVMGAPRFHGPIAFPPPYSGIIEDGSDGVIVYGDGGFVSAGSGGTTVSGRDGSIQGPLGGNVR